MEKIEDIQYIEKNYFCKTNNELSTGINMSIEELLIFVKENNIDISRKAKKDYQLKYVKEHYGKVHNIEIEEHLNIGRKRLNEIAKELNIFVDPHNYSELTEEEKVKYIKEHSGKKTKKDILKYLHISSRKFDAFVKENEIKFQKTKVKNISSTPDVLNIIQKKYKQLGAEKLAEKLNCSASFVRERAKELGLTNGSPIWSDEEDDILMDYYEDLSLERLQKRLKGKGYKRTLKAIRKRMKTLHIHILEYGMFLTTSNIKDMLGFSTTKVAYIYRRYLETELFNGFRRCTINNFEKFLKEHPNLWNSLDADIEGLKILLSKTSSSKYASKMNFYSVDWISKKYELDYVTEKISKRSWNFEVDGRSWNEHVEQKYKQLKEEGKTLNEIKLFFDNPNCFMKNEDGRIQLRILEGRNNNVSINA